MGPRADDQHAFGSGPLARARSGCQPLRHSSMKAVFWVQRLIAAGHVAGDADVAADAFADVFEPAFLDLLRQEGVGDGRPRRADEIEDARR